MHVDRSRMSSTVSSLSRIDVELFLTLTSDVFFSLQSKNSEDTAEGDHLILNNQVQFEA